jgi:hypothetical protein
MIHPLPLSTLRTTMTRPLRLGVLASWSPTLVWIAGIALCLLLALATLPRAAWADEAAPVAQAPVAALESSVTPAPASRTRNRCEICGVVETIRPMDPVGTSPAAYEFTVRLRDGSTRVSTVAATTASAWTVGDAIMLIGGV